MRGAQNYEVGEVITMPSLIDLTGRRFGRLVVLSRAGAVWHCQCDCGKTCDVAARNLLHRGTVSCGCYRRERSVENLSGSITEKLGQVDGTNLSRLVNTKAQANNRSGYRGVSWHKNSYI